MITFVCFVLWTLKAPWWVYVLSIFGIICEFDTSGLAHKEDFKKIADALEEENDERNYI